MGRPPDRHVCGLLALAAVLTVSSGTAQAQSPALLLETRCEALDPGRRCVLWGPSLLELITRPEIYDGRRVRVIGWVNLAPEDTALYLSQADWENGLTRSAVWVALTPWERAATRAALDRGGRTPYKRRHREPSPMRGPVPAVQ